MSIKLSIAAAILLHIVSSGVAQNNDIKFTPINGPNGKPIGKIRNITQDPHGYMWFSDEVERCIYRYDGNRIIAFRHDNANPNSLGSIDINSVYADNTGIIWISFRDGMDRYDPATGIFTHYRHDPNNPGSLSSSNVNQVLRDRQGRLWVGTNNGLDRLDEKTGKFIHYRNELGNPKSLSDNVVWNIYEDRQGVIWIATGFPFFETDSTKNTGGLSRLNTDGTFTQYKHDPKDPHSLINNKVRALFEDSRGVFWVGTKGDGLHIMDRRTGRFERHLYDPKKPDQLSRPPRKKEEFAFNNDQVTFIIEDVTGSIWIGTMWSGINRYNPLTKKITHYEGSHGFPDSSAWNAFISRDGMLWLSTQQDHLFRAGPFPRAINNINPGIQTNSFLEDKEGFLWTGTKYKGLLQYDKQKKLVQHFKNGPSNQFNYFNTAVNCLVQNKEDSIWIGTDDGVVIFNTITKQFSNFPLGFAIKDDIGNGIFNIFHDSQGLKWFATGQGLASYNSIDGSIKRYHHSDKDSGSIGSNRIISFLEDRTGKFWVGIFNDGINQFERQTGKFMHYLSGLNGICMYQDKEGIIWAGMNKGLYTYNIKDDVFTPYFDSQSEFSTEYIFGITEDQAKNLWITTRSAIIKLNPKRSERSVYASNFGIPKHSLTPNAIYKTKEGQLLVGHNNGFYAFFPGELEIAKKDSKIIITDFFIDNHAVLPGKKSSLKKRVEELSTLVLKHNQNNLAFNFAAIDYRAPENTKYFTMLEGYDNRWREITGEKSSYYFKLSPDNYVYRIKAVNLDGEEQEKKITIRIHPAWWNTWLFRIASVFFVGVVFYLLMRWRIKQKFKLRLERSEKERQVAELKQKGTELEMQALRAQMNPHFIFNSLNSINRFILQNNRGQASEYLTKFSKLVRMILQNSQASLITLESELESLELYLNLEALRFNYHFDYKIAVPKDMDISALQVPPLILQPYVENAIWHGLMHKEEKGQLDVEVSEENDHLYFRITDNGIGREKAAAMASKSATKHKSMGLRITAHRIAIVQNSETLTSPVTINDLVNTDGSAAGTEVVIKMPVMYD